MPQLYQEVTDDEGNSTYEAVEADALPALINDDIVRATEAYKDVLDESVKRRKTVKSLREELTGAKDALQAAQNELVVDDDDDDEEEPEPKPIEPMSREDLAEYVLQKLDERDSKKTEADDEKRKQTDELLEKHGLGEDDRTFLIGAKDPQEAAAHLGRLRTRFEDAVGGEMPTTADALAEFGERLLKNLELD